MSESTNAHEPLRDLSAAEALKWIEANVSSPVAGARPAELPVSAIETVEPLFQPRAVAEWHVMSIAGAIKVGRKVDPLLVYAVGGRNLLLDGHHRLAAYRFVGVTSAVPVVFFEGTPTDAVLEARARNSETKLPMSTSERHDDAWRLVRLGRHSKTEICRSSNVSKGSVDAMRKAFKALGEEEAADCKSWRLARARAEGKGGKGDMTDDERQAWLDEMAEGWADRLFKAFGTKLQTNPEVAAMALASHFGRCLPNLAGFLRDHLPKRSEWGADNDEDF
jgi:ParB-like chromosome segregation protein Spo0J